MKTHVLFASLVLATSTAATVCAQSYPSRVVRVIVAYPPGGSIDVVTRLVNQRLSAALGQQFIAENRAGAAGNIGTDYVAKATPDGYTLFLAEVGPNAVSHALAKLPYDPEKDFVTLGYVSAYPFVLLARPDLPGNSLAEWVAYAKERPGKLTYGSGGIGTLQYTWGTILVGSLGLELLHIPYKGATQAHQEMMAGRLDVMFDNISAGKQHVQSGRLKALAVSSAMRSPLLPQVATVNEAGLGKFEGESWFALYAPAATPAPTAAPRTNPIIVENLLPGEGGWEVVQTRGVIAGYACFNDGSVRDWQFKGSQWTLGKNFDGTGAFGPDVVTADELPPGASPLRIMTRVNGKVQQDSNTDDLIFDVPTLVHELSKVMTLEPGDIIITGTPSGVAAGRKPPNWLKVGDTVDSPYRQVHQRYWQQLVVETRNPVPADKTGRWLQRAPSHRQRGRK